MPAEETERAAAALRSASGVGQVSVPEGQPGWLSVTLAQANGQPAETLMNDAVRAVADAGIPLLSLEVEGARLSDAFLEMTEAS